jgi:hypothetical protein
MGRGLEKGGEAEKEKRREEGG